MADIAMCSGKECPIKESCYRHLAKVGVYQSYFLKPPYNKRKNKCEYYWETNQKNESNTNI